MSGIQLPALGALIEVEPQPDGSLRQRVAVIDDTPPECSDNPSAVFLVGDPNGDLAGVNILEQVLDPATGLAFSVTLMNPPALDPNRAAIQSDAPAQLNLKGYVGQNIHIDTTGYETLNITTQGMVANIFGSNDGVTFSAITGFSVGLGAASVTAIAAVNSYVIPCITRYIRLAVTTAGSATAYLRAAPLPGLYFASQGTVAGINYSQYGSQTVASAGAGGVAAVGGNIAPGAAPTANPNLVAGVDSGEVRLAAALTAVVPVPLTRRLLTDITGRLRLAHELQGASIQNTPVLGVQDVTQFEGQSIVDIFAQVLLELRILNHQLYELPRMMNAGTGALDEPASFRQDPTIFSQ